MHNDKNVFCCLQLRNFSAILLHSNNMFSRDISVFKRAQIYFSVGGVYFASRPIVHEPRSDRSSETSRQVIIPVVPARVGRAVRLSLQFDLRWIMISEVRFASGEFNIITFPRFVLFFCSVLQSSSNVHLSIDQSVKSRPLLHAVMLTRTGPTRTRTRTRIRATRTRTRTRTRTWPTRTRNKKEDKHNTRFLKLCH